MPAVPLQVRWSAELRELARSFPGFTRQEVDAASRIDIPVRSNAGNRYVLRIYTLPGYPDVCPVMVVAHPTPLCDRNRQPMQEISGEMHTLGTYEGMTEICHFRPSLWEADYSLQMVAMKGRIWLEAYEGHLRTGHTIDHWLPHQTATGQADAPLAAETAPSRPGLLGRLGRTLRRLLGA